MIDTLKIFEELSQTMEPEAARKLASVLGMIYADLQNTVTKTEFNDLRAVVRELAEAQKRTEERLGRLEVVVAELAEAQKRTEERLGRLEGVVTELAEAQKRTEERLGRLEVVVTELAEAQKRTEERLGRLEGVVAELAEAQKRTEDALTRLTERVDRLAEGLDDLRKQVGGLSATVGYGLENEAMKALPALLERDFSLHLREPLYRGYLKDDRSRDIEVNLIGLAERGGLEIRIIGESKVQLSKNDVDNFLDRRIAGLRPVLGSIFPVLVAHMIAQPDVLEYAKAKGVPVYLSYQF